jgi:hypothetical protein
MLRAATLCVQRKRVCTLCEACCVRLCVLRAVWYACDGTLVSTLRYPYVGPDWAFVAETCEGGGSGTNV